MKTIPEIEGLRAIAVMVVVLFHAQISLFSGGYVGVDVFFVISGYLITGLLWKEWQSEHQLKLPRFYARRILRLAPALAVVSVAVALVFSFLLPPVVSTEVSASLMAAQWSLSNLWFYLHTDYFADNTVNPVLHTWSLAVEEQFYLTLPLLLLWSARHAEKQLRTLLGVLAALSFLAAVLTVKQHPNQAFYFPWLRAWELLLGSTLAVSAFKVRHVTAARLLTWLGLAGIFAPCLSYSEHTLFPGASALLPVLGTAAVIASTGHTTLAHRWLGLGPLRWLGKISYSVYLVHWPIICVAAITVSLHPMAVRIFAVLLSLVLGWACWKWVETPWRARTAVWPAWRVVKGFLAFNLALCLLVLGIRELGQWSWQQFPQALSLSTHMKESASLFRTGSCFVDRQRKDGSLIDDKACLTPAGNGREGVLIMGDSHAANLWHALQELHPVKSFMQGTASGCRPLHGQATGTTWCLALNQYLFDAWLPHMGAKVDTVVLAGRWETSELSALQHTVGYLSSLGKKVVVIGPTPEYFMAVPLMLAYEDVSGLSLSSRMLKRDRIALDSSLGPAIAGTGARYHSMVRQLCTRDTVTTCLTMTQGVPVWSDRDHFTGPGALAALRTLQIP